MITRTVQALVYLAVPVAGILFFDWDWRSVIVLYWLQNITVGLRNIIDMLRTTVASSPEEIASFTFNDRPLSDAATKPVLIPFFMVHYGIFTTVHGVFVFMITYGFLPGFTGGAPSDLGSFDLRSILLVWVVGSIVQLIMGCFTPRDALPPVRQLFFKPYPRIIVLHLTVLLGVYVINAFNWPPAAALLLVALQFVVDLTSSRRDGRAAPRSPQSA